MNWIWITLIVIAGSAIINPLLYFIYWELYDREEWIQEKMSEENDKRFFVYESTTRKTVQIAPVRPQIKDMWKSQDYYGFWWIPIISTFTVLFYICIIIAKPFEKFWKCIVNKIANVKI